MANSEVSVQEAVLTQVLESLVDLRHQVDALTKRSITSDEPLQRLREAAIRLKDLSIKASDCIYVIRSSRLSQPTNAEARRTLTGARTGLSKPIWNKEAACLQKYGINEDELRWATAVAIARTAWGVRLRLNPNPVAHSYSFELLTETIVEQLLSVASIKKNMKRIKGLKRLRRSINGLITLCANSQMSAGETYYLSHSLASGTLGRTKLPRSSRNDGDRQY
jgi:hypothetical protein